MSSTVRIEIDEEHLGPDATEDDARWMVEALRERGGWDIHYGPAGVHALDDDEYSRREFDAQWRELLAAIPESCTHGMHMPLASIAADMPGEPRISIYHDGTRLYTMLPDGTREDICDGECSPADATQTISDMYGACREWELEWAD